MAERGPLPPETCRSLFAALAYAATGRASFGSGDPDGAGHRAVREPIDLAGVAPDLTALIEACLAKDAVAGRGSPR
ncbi:hypothetical protein FB563_3077 [Streptomyces puniciscabiei]|uniref:Uncharacterized protein n=1 Tax=Streptomyces puniciscabiei TaxID=164348 RepID=A0A542UG96_9ACTN|nr:hypothetical protein [Streptomyces puniciscabiei]TQK98064.1 hypothetical protein FB563_3077 [Streptomyces puniciscabiei]